MSADKKVKRPEITGATISSLSHVSLGVTWSFPALPRGSLAGSVTPLDRVVSLCWLRADDAECKVLKTINIRVRHTSLTTVFCHVFASPRNGSSTLHYGRRHKLEDKLGFSSGVAGTFLVELIQEPQAGKWSSFDAKHSRLLLPYCCQER